jgi:prepilin-type N-terminal cleavage/methylation domain-containing protein
MNGDDRGFTLVELIVVVALMGVVALSVGSALFLGIRTASNTYTRFDQSNSALTISRYLTPDISTAEGEVFVNNMSDSTCGVAPLKVWSRSSAALDSRDTVVTWSLAGTDLVRRTCVNGASTNSRVIASGIESFAPATCAAPCNAATITVTFRAKGQGQIEPQTWTITVGRRGVTS